MEDNPYYKRQALEVDLAVNALKCCWITSLGHLGDITRRISGVGCHDLAYHGCLFLISTGIGAG